MRKNRQKRQRPQSIIDLPFISILERRPATNQFIMLAWSKGGYSGYESTYWDVEDALCQHAVAWLPLPKTHVFTKACAVQLKRSKLCPVLRWSHHFSCLIGDLYYSKDKLPKVAESV
jgi:hypothetical protein